MTDLAQTHAALEAQIADAAPPIRLTLPRSLGTYTDEQRHAIARWLEGIVVDVRYGAADDWVVEEFFVK